MIKLPKPVHSENYYETIIRHALIAQDWWVKKLHGNIYQSGLPDLLICRPEDGKIMLLEIKTTLERTEYTCVDIMMLLQGPQCPNILLLAKKKAHIYVIAGCSRGYLLATPPFSPHQKIYPVKLEEVIKTLSSVGVHRT